MTTAPHLGTRRPAPLDDPPRLVRRATWPCVTGDRHACRTPISPAASGGRRRLRRCAPARAADAGQRRRLGRRLPRRPGRRPGRAGRRAGRRPALDAAYDPDVVVGRARAASVAPRRVRATTLHPDLALLLSTCGSTGSPKLVRLGPRRSAGQRRRHRRGARRSGPTDVAATTLPLHYCYGLSVLHSHLLPAPSVMLTDASVRRRVRSGTDVATHGVTTFPGVPHTFELLERSGFADRDLPSLRSLTQAGGRMAARAGPRFAELGQRRGFDLFVMYGATEATARMSVLPAGPRRSRRRRRSAARCRAPASSLRSRTWTASSGVGELVFTGPNVMLGYADVAGRPGARRAVDASCAPATSPAARPTGSGRSSAGCSRIAKVCGLRIDLDRVERTLRDRRDRRGRRRRRGPARRRGRRRRAARRRRGRSAGIAAELTGVPARAVEVVVLPDLPRLAERQGRPPALRWPLAPATATSAPRPATTSVDRRRRDRALRDRLLGPPGRPARRDSFVDLGGDSLSYVEVVAAARAAARPSCPRAGTTMPAAALARLAPGRRRVGPSRSRPTSCCGRSRSSPSSLARQPLHAPRRRARAARDRRLQPRPLPARRPAAAAAGPGHAARPSRGWSCPSVLVIGTVAAVSRRVSPGGRPRSLTGVHRVELVRAALELLVHRGARPRPPCCWPALLASRPSTAPRAGGRSPLPVVLTLALTPRRFDLFGIPGDHVHRRNGMLWLFTLGWAIVAGHARPGSAWSSAALTLWPWCPASSSSAAAATGRTSPSGCSR